VYFEWKRAILGTTVAITCLLGAVAAGGQAAPAQSPQLSQDVFKAVQILRGIPVDEFMDTMGMFSASLGLDCVSCHDPGIVNRDLFAVTTPRIQRARQMMLMTNAINSANFAGAPRISCFTCHRGQISPQFIPSLALQYGELIEDPSAIAISPDAKSAADAIFDKYVQALGGAARLASLTSYVATGMYTGFNTGGAPVPIEIYAKAPDQRAQIIRVPDGDGFKVYDGRNAWVAERWRPLPLMALTGGNLEGAKMEAIMSFPAGIRGAFSQWRSSSTVIDDRRILLLQATNAGQLPVNFYFDESGLLVRVVRWSKIAVGTLPIQIDYSDYREAAGIKMPFRTIMTWTDGQSTIELNQVRPNVPVDASRFATPGNFQRQ
jgi:outer membrane lipoprotein-sorting protein